MTRNLGPRLAGLALLCAAGPLEAQTPVEQIPVEQFPTEQALVELDALSDRTAEEASGIALAREQVARGALLEALATLERVLAQFPKSHAARFDHAMVLCWVGDPQGAGAEFARFDEDDYDDGALDRARADCRPVQRQEG